MTTATQPATTGNCPIRQYRDLWDIPRMFVVEHGGQTLLYDCPFDEAAEDYAREYTVYHMPQLSDADLEGPWADLPGRAVRRLGTVQVADVAFGPDPRTSVSRSSVEPFLSLVPIAATAPRPLLWAASGLEAVGVVVAAALLIDAVWLHRINPFAFGLALLVSLVLVQLGGAVLRVVRPKDTGQALPGAIRFLVRVAEQPAFAVATVIPVVIIYVIKAYPWIEPVVQDG